MSGALEPASPENLRVLLQSEDFIVVDKHCDLRIDSKMWYEKNTVQAQLRQRFPLLADPLTYYGFRFCHQLDFSTSGALCVALNKAAAGRAYRCFKDRTVTKGYLALLRGRVEGENRTIDFSIGKTSTEGKTHMMCIEGTEGCENPKACQTELRVLEYGTYDGEPATKVLLEPLTGRTHQLRVHCSALGHPIVGDFTYSLGADSAPYRMMLHAHLLRLPLEPRALQVTAGDPFLPALDPKWLPQCTLRTAGGAVESLLDRAAAKEEEKDKEKKRKEEERRKEMKKKKNRKAESEEQKRPCQDWLSEWGTE
ncbi:hypothetical protein NHX12_032199 [Muraenolepis orangiensis]|uniref:Pseudouridine synthase RsuA/RluA-like domain-containing protein n=1 Tax=Muraenolepis orangiensis TaxID=630683 RepID=A0A9Q0ILB2_9TELE|nr:hypothetical protein NHX12_032199 [Muraenolepis orangiensis]